MEFMDLFNNTFMCLFFYFFLTAVVTMNFYHFEDFFILLCFIVKITAYTHSTKRNKAGSVVAHF